MLFADQSDDSELKLIDFGFAFAVKPECEIMTEQLGTPSYMVPELWSPQLGAPYDSSVDVWALGVVAYMMLSGVRPFHSPDKAEKARMIREDPLKFPHVKWRNVSPGAKMFCSQLLQKHPKNRLSASEAIKHPWLREHSRARSRRPDIAAAALAQQGVVASLEAYASSEQMRQLALSVIAFKTSPQRLAGLRDVFQTWDADCSGTIDL